MSGLARKLLLFAAISLIAAVAGYFSALLLREPPEARLAAVGGPAIDFRLLDLEGKPRSLADWRGKLVILNFWATWCPPCREEIPLLNDFQRRHGARGAQVVGIAFDPPEMIYQYLDEQHIAYPVLQGAGRILELMARYGNTTGSLPFTVILAPDGNILARKLGAYSRAELEALARHLPQTQSTSAPTTAK